MAFESVNSVLIVSNNPRVAEAFTQFEQLSCESYEDVLLRARDRIHAGGRLITHPLAGSVKPGESPYRSVAVSKDEGNLDMRSLEVIESAIDRFRTLTSVVKDRQYPEQAILDFQLIDYNLLKTGLESLTGR